MEQQRFEQHNHMIYSAKIAGYRGFNQFNLNGLGRINLFVGRNNSGKSSVLEALYLLAMAGDPAALWTTIVRRGEQLAFENVPGKPIQPELEVSHLFNGHEVKVGVAFSVMTANAVPDLVSCTVVQANPQENPALFANLQTEGEFASNNSLALKIEGTRVKSGPLIPLTRREGFRQDTFQLVMNVANRQPSSTPIQTQYVSTASLTVQELINTFSQIVLTPDEDRVITALRALDPDIERIAATSAGVFHQLSGRGGFLVKKKGFDRPIPIGSFGDGMWRLLALAIGIGRAKDGILFIDEIDTGLHHSAMTNMWKLIYSAARELNVQVFATTHSYDCVRSLASICNEDSIETNDVTIHRIEPDKSDSIPYTAKQIKIAAQQDIEVR